MWYFKGSAPEPLHAPLPARFEVLTPPTSDPMSFALSADGRQLAFVSASEGVSKLWVRPIDQITAQTFVGTDGASYPFWAPDGRSIAFFADGKLKRLNFDGSLPHIITDAPTGRGGTWSQDGVILFSPTTASTLMRVPANGGTPVPVTRLMPGENSHRWPQFLPRRAPLFVPLDTRCAGHAGRLHRHARQRERDKVARR